MQFQDNYPLKDITTLGIGGPAKKFVIVKSGEELIKAIEYSQKENLPYLLIGEGSNLLIADEGFDGLVIKNEISGISTSKESKPTFEVSTKSGTRLQDVVDYAIQQGLSGLQKLAGIPGTVGGAVYGNAGAYGQSISDHITSVVALGPLCGLQTCQESDPGCTPSGLTRMTLKKNECTFTYRDSIFKKNHFVILEATFQLEPADPEILQKEAEDVLSKRSVKYPPGLKCPGSFFKNLVAADLPAEVLKNIPADKIVYGKIPAGTLLEEVGAKGQCSGGIEIASYHANLFLNQGNGTAKAFYDLAKVYTQKVKEKFGITLEPEVQLINLPPLI